MERRGFLKGLLGIGVAAGAVAARKIEKKVDEVKKDVEVENQVELPNGDVESDGWKPEVYWEWGEWTTGNRYCYNGSATTWAPYNGIIDYQNVSTYDDNTGWFINSNGILTRL